MESNLRCKSVLVTVVMVFLFFGVGICQGRPIYVDADAPGTNDGTSWENAYKYLQDALADATSDPNIIAIHVANGNYYPDENTAEPNGSNNRYATFQLINGVGIYGGFPSSGDPNWNDRDPNAYVTILSGDLLGNDGPGEWEDYGENSCHVVRNSGTEPNAVLDGFIITGGNANESPANGGGMYNINGNPTLRNCKFLANMAKFGGGGIYNNNSSPNINNCVIMGNWATDSQSHGGGIQNYNSSNPDIINCTLNNNQAKLGGGISNRDNSSPSIDNCTISNNSASQSGPVLGCGGGIHNRDNSNPDINNCFVNNNSADFGGGIYNDSSSPVISNCSITGNSSIFGSGGGIHNRDNSNPVISNCVVSNNTAGAGGGGIYNLLYCNPIINNCTIVNNSATNEGGGICNHNDSSPSINNCTISDNIAGSGGGGIYNTEKCSPSISNCVINNNSAVGSAIYNWTLSWPTINNCTISNNSGAPLIYCYDSCTMRNSIVWGNESSEVTKTSVRYCDFQGGHWGTGNINVDPCFANPDVNDFHLTGVSPCIDTGDNNSVPADITDLDGDGNTTEPIPWDFDNRDRVVDGDCNTTDIIDMGAYEFNWLYIGDFAGGCDVDFIDFSVFALTWLLEEGQQGYDPNCDISLPVNGIIDERDLKVFCGNWLEGID